MTRFSLQRQLRAGAVALVLVAAAGCGGGSPTVPRLLDLSGRWVGDLPLRLPDEDWSFTLIVLRQDGNEITGTMTSRDGVRRGLNGTFSGERAELQVGGLAGDSTCSSIQLTLIPMLGGTSIERLAGVATGRCYGTVAGSFTLIRAD